MCVSVHVGCVYHTEAIPKANEGGSQGGMCIGRRKLIAVSPLTTLPKCSVVTSS